MTRLLLAICLIFSSACTARTRKPVLFAFSTAMIVEDMVQTRTLTHYCLEENPVIGTCGMGAPPTLYFAAMLVANAVMSWKLGEWYDGLVGGVEANAVIWNYQYLRDTGHQSL